MKSKRDCLLNIESLKVFNQLLIYDKSRTVRTLLADPLIQKLELRVKNRVVSSMLTPKRAVLELYNEVMCSSIVDEIVDYVFVLCQSILSQYDYDPRKILFVAVLRSGFPLASLLRYVIYRLRNIKVEVVAITPNYIDQIDIVSFRNHIDTDGSDKDVVFIDGWCSEGTTYTIVKRFWNNLFPNKDFKYVVLLNLSSIESDDLLCATGKDVLIPWSICQTDNLGISNYFLHPGTNRSCAFLIPGNRRKIQNSEISYRRIIDYRIRNGSYPMDVQTNKRKKKSSNKKKAERLAKLGINECIKSIDKNDAVELYVNERISGSHANILKRYAQINSLPFQITSGENCLVVRDFSQ